MFLLLAKYKLTYVESSRDTVIHKSLQEQDLNTPVKKVWTTSQDLHSITLTPTVSTLRPLPEQHFLLQWYTPMNPDSTVSLGNLTCFVSALDNGALR